MKKRFWLNLFLVCVGVVVGTLAAELCADISFLSWMTYGLHFGMTTPLVLDLHVTSLTLGISVNLNIAVILFIILSLVLGRLIAKK